MMFGCEKPAAAWASCTKRAAKSSGFSCPKQSTCARFGKSCQGLHERYVKNSNDDPDAYVPHQLAGEEDDGEAPVLIVAPGVATPDRAMVINLRDACAVGTFDSVKEVVPADESERAGSRARWTEYRQRGFAVRKFDM